MRLFNSSLTLFVIASLQFACSPTVDSTSAVRQGNSPQNSTPGTSKGGADNTADPKSAANKGSKEGEDFFRGQILAAFRASSENCLSCHDAPRNVLNVPNASDQAIYDYDKMFSLLKKGEFSNDNGFINPMLGKSTHPGAQICSNEEDPLCKLAIDWYRLEFAGGGASSSGQLLLVELQGVDKHVVKGYAKDIDNVDQKLTVKAYIDGDKDAGTLIGDAVADRFQSSDIGNHAFSIDVPAAMLDNKARQVYVYAIKGGEEELLGGSPYTFTAFRQNDAFPGTGALGINTGCGCHTPNDFTYDTLWPDLATATNKAQPVSPTNNRGYEFTQGGSGRANLHGGGGPGAQGNAGAYISWWCAEFDVDNNVAGCN